MSNREEAQEFLDQLRQCRAKSFFGRLDDTQRGIGFVLLYLREAEGVVYSGDLARELNVSTARIAVLLKNMEKNGLLTRSASRKDARRTIIALTPAGIAQVDEMREHILDAAELLIERVGKDDLDEFLRISMKMKNALEE